MPKPAGFSGGHGRKTNDGIKLHVQSTVVGHISKGMWVSQDIAGVELYVFMDCYSKKECLHREILIGVIFIAALFLSRGSLEIALLIALVFASVLACTPPIESRRGKIKSGGFIQIPLLIIIVVGALILGGAGYFGVKQYRNYQNQKLEKEKQVKETQELKEKESKELAETQQKALEEAKSEIENLKKQTEDQKKKQNIIEQKLSQDKKEKSVEITSAELKPYITGVVKVSCSNSSGSGTLWKFDANQYSVVTNLHVVKNISVNNPCDVVAEDLNGNGLGVFSTDSAISNWNDIADVTVLNLKIWDKMPKYLENDSIVPFSAIEDLNYGISSLPNCPASMPVGSPVAIVGYPAFGRQQITGVGEMTSRIVSNGIISGYDTAARFSGLPYKNYFISAKIDSGNSGGIAFSKTENGLCDLGIPTWLTIGNYETQGLVQNIHNILYQPDKKIRLY